LVSLPPPGLETVEQVQIAPLKLDPVQLLGETLQPAAQRLTSAHSLFEKKHRWPEAERHGPNAGRRVGGGGRCDGGRLLLARVEEEGGWCVLPFAESTRKDKRTVQQRRLIV
jgi:hypothetical protein